VLLNYQAAGDLPAHEQIVRPDVRNVGLGMRNEHWRIVELNEVKVTDRSGFNLGLKAHPSLWPRVVIHDLFTCRAMPVVEPITRVYLAGRKEDFHVCFPLRRNCRALPPVRPIPAGLIQLD
jgi:hypothetical protein